MTLRQYEGMFLFDSGFATDLSKAETEIKRILDRAEAEIVFCRKWDERRLAYEIKGHKRGTYMLTYFKCRPDIVVEIERDVKLSESILRVLVLQAEHVTSERMNEFSPEKRAEAPPDEERKPGDDEKPKDEETAPIEMTDDKVEPIASSVGHDDDVKAVEETDL